MPTSSEQAGPKAVGNRETNMNLTRKFALLLVLAGCTPTVQVAVPTEPITINLNVRIEHEIRVQVEEDLDALFSEDSGLF